MELEQRVEELKNHIELMRKCYCKGFTNAICGIYSGSENYLTEPTDEMRDLILRNLDRVETHYAGLPFQELNSNEDFAPLFVVRDLLQKYGEIARQFLIHPTIEGVDAISHRRTTIGEVGEVYRGNFRRRLAELREIPGQENFRVVLVDYENRQYGM